MNNLNKYLHNFSFNLRQNWFFLNYLVISNGLEAIKHVFGFLNILWYFSICFIKFNTSPADSPYDLAWRGDVFFKTDYDRFKCPDEESSWWHLVIIEHFDIHKMASKMVACSAISFQLWEMQQTTYFTDLYKTAFH